MTNLRSGAAVLAVMIAAPVGAQGIASRVGSAPNGTVLITFAARAGICGDGRSYIAEAAGSPDGVTIYSTDGSSDYVSLSTGPGSFQSGMKTCEPGPVRVMLSIANHRPTAFVSMYDAIGDRTVKERLIAILAERGDRAGTDKLAAIAKGDADYDLRRRAARRLSDAGDPRAKQLLEDTRR